MSVKFHDIEQNSEEWFDLRAGKMTSSKAATVMANFGKAFGDPAKRYAQDIALERVTGKRIDGGIPTTKAMEEGTEKEPIARARYEEECMKTVTNGGFWEDGNFGDSPDGMVKDYPIEIKCPQHASHWKVLKDGGYDSTYKWQIQFHIMVTGAPHCDFISFHPDFPEGKQLHVFRVERDEDMQMQMKIRFSQFEEMVQENIKLLQA